MVTKNKATTSKKKKGSTQKKAVSKIPKWGSKTGKVKITYWIIEETANKIRAIAASEGKPQGDIVSEYMSNLVNVKCSMNKNINPIPIRKNARPISKKKK